MSEHLARRCPFCGSSNVLLEDNRGEFEQPDGFLPFELDDSAAARAVEKALRSGLRRLKAWWTGEQGRPGQLQGMYLPFWVFDGVIESRKWESSLSSPTPAGGITPLADMMMIDNLPVAAITMIEEKALQRLFPFDYKATVRYEPRLLANWAAALYGVDVEYAAETAYDRMLQWAQANAPPLVPPDAGERATRESRLVVHRRSFQVTSITYQLVLLPVWLQPVQEGDRQRLAAVNGQNGRVTFGREMIPVEEEDH